MTEPMTRPTTQPPAPERRPRALVAAAVAFVLLAAAIGGLNLLSHLVGGTVERTLAFPPPGGGLVVQVHAGDVTVVPSGDGQVHVRTVAHSGPGEPDLLTEATAAGLLLDARCGWPLGGQCEIEHEVAVPGSVPVSVTSGSEDVRARGLTGPLLVDIESGDVTLRDLTGPVQVTSSSGEVIGDRLRGDPVRVQTGSGDVALDLLDPRAVQVRSGSGEVELAVPGDLRYRVDVRTGSGDRQVDVPDDAGADRSVVVAGDSGDVLVRPTG